jgi:hypothetical protein
MNDLVSNDDLKVSAAVLQQALPKGSRGILTQENVKKINELITSCELKENYRDNLLAFTSVLKEGKFKLEDYAHAVKYVSYKLIGDSNIAAYTKTFPARYQRLIDKGTPTKDIHSLISAYNRNVLVTKILEQAIVPSWLLNQDLYQKALNTQAELMQNAKSEKVRTEAANSLLGHLKMPEVAKVHLDVDVKEDDSIRELRESTLELVRQQRAMLEAGVMNAREIANTKIVKGVTIDNEGTNEKETNGRYSHE